jgi:hypothetical protein
MQMTEENKFTLHRKRSDADEDKVVAVGSKADVLRMFNELPQETRPQYSMMDGGMKYNHLEIENILRERK